MRVHLTDPGAITVLRGMTTENRVRFVTQAILEMARRMTLQDFARLREEEAAPRRRGRPRKSPAAGEGAAPAEGRQTERERWERAHPDIPWKLPGESDDDAWARRMDALYNGGLGPGWE